MSENSNTTVVQKGGIGFCGALTILFIGLKLTGHINWGWLWVLSPLWIPTAIFVSFLIVILAIAVLASVGGSKRR